MTSALSEDVRLAALSAGASAVGITTAGPFEQALVTIRRSQAEHRSGPLRFVYDEPEVATDIRASFPWAVSIVVVGVSYLPSAAPPSATGAIVARFATSNQYLAVRDVTDAVVDVLVRSGAHAETLIDDNRLVDRAAAIRSGLGWSGRSTMVLTPAHGPWMLLGSVATDANLASSQPMRRDCGSCEACFPACPTRALGDNGLDARRCLSTWLQTSGSLPHWIRSHVGRRIYGCDDCLTSCPPGWRALEVSRSQPLELRFSELLAMDDTQLLDRFVWWYVPRRQGRYLRRNLLVAAGNSRESPAHEAITTHLGHRSSMIRSHAAWALARAIGAGALETLMTMLSGETAPETREEILLAILMVQHPNSYQHLLALDEHAHTTNDVDGVALVGPDLGLDRAIEPDFDVLTLLRGAEPEIGDPELLERLIRVYDPRRRLERARREARAITAL